MNIETKYFRFITWYTGNSLTNTYEGYTKWRLLKIFGLKYIWKKSYV